MAEISNDLLNNRVVFNVDSFEVQFKEYLKQGSRYFAGLRYAQCLTRLLKNSFGEDYFNKYSLDGYNFLGCRSIRYVSSVFFVIAATLVRRIESDQRILADRNFSDLYGGVSSESIKTQSEWWAHSQQLPSSISCPSELAAHGAGRIIEKWRRGPGYFKGQCSCGLRVAYYGEAELRVTKWSVDYERKVVDLSEKGMNSNSIARQLKMQENSVIRILNNAGLPPSGKKKKVAPNIECPSFLAFHGRGHIIEQMKWGDGAFRGTCSCGVKVVVKLMPDGGFAVRIGRLSPDYRHEVKRLAALGISACAIARQLEMSETTVFRYLQKVGAKTRRQEAFRRSKV